MMTRCERCGMPVREARQICSKRTYASLFCWAPDDPTAIEIQAGLKIRAGDAPAIQSLPPDDPYGEKEAHDSHT